MVAHVGEPHLASLLLLIPFGTLADATAKSLKEDLGIG